MFALISEFDVHINLFSHLMNTVTKHQKLYKDLHCTFSWQLSASPKLPVLINKARLHLIIVGLSFNGILFYVRLSLLSTRAVSFCLIRR